MAKITIEKPNYGTRKKSGAFGFFVLIIFLSAVFAAAYYQYAIPVAPVADMEIFEASGAVEHYEVSTHRWQPVRQGSIIRMGDKLRTDEGSEVNFGIPNKLKVRLKPESEFVYSAPKLFEKKPDMRLGLDAGIMFVATSKALSGDPFFIETPRLKLRARAGYFRVAVDSITSKTTIGLMRGNAEISQNELFAKESVPIKGLETITSEKGSVMSAPGRVTREEWKQMGEIYDLILKSDADEAVQMDLSKAAGSFFNYVFDHGTFYTPKFGYAGREFFRDLETGEVYMEMEYDVFPRGTFSGAYIKVRDADLKDFATFEFEMRRVEEEGFPMNIRVELKTKTGVARAFAAKLPKRKWQHVSFPIHVKESAPLTEVTFVFMHDRVGEYKRGAIQLRRLNLAAAAEENESSAVKELLPETGVQDETLDKLNFDIDLDLDKPAQTKKTAALPGPGDFLFEEVKRIQPVHKKAVEEVVKQVEVVDVVGPPIEFIKPAAQNVVKRPKISLKDLPLLEDIPDY